MFSYTINNSNNLKITNHNYHVIPFGHRCGTAISCIYANIRKFALPFDWGIPWFPSTIHKVLQNNFDGIYDFTYHENSHNCINKTYNIGTQHFNNLNEYVIKLTRRVNRWNHILQDPSHHIYFVYINEDYLYDPNYRTNKFNEKNFKEMVELECFLKQKYINLDYTILYFNFVKHDIPINSKIINIVLQSEIIYDKSIDSPFEKLRIFCGEILSNLFHTDLNVNNYLDCL